MSEKQFEAFLVEHLKSWLAPRIKAGERYQFRSTDPENTVRLIAALHQASSGTRVDIEHPLHYLDINGLQVIIAGHAEDKKVSDGCYTENYLARLRDEVVNWDACLLMVHNSNLDTANNSALDLASSGMVWSNDVIKSHLEGLIDHNLKNAKVSRCLLEIQSRAMASDASSIFGYRSLYESMTDGDLRFDELGLFNDELLVSDWADADKRLKPKDIERRIDDNRKLREEIEFEIEHHADELEERLSQFGSKFVKENFIKSDDWKGLSFDTLLGEIEKQKQQALTFEDIVYDQNQGTLDYRSKKESVAGKREQHVLYQVSQGAETFEFDLKFSGASTTKAEFEIQPKAVAKTLELVHRPRGNNTTVTIAGPASLDPLFFTIAVRRDLSSEAFKFHCIVLPEGLFYLEDITSHFLVNRTKKSLVLQSEDQKLKVNPQKGDEHTLLDSGEDVDVTSIGTLDFKQLYDESDEVRFYLKNGTTTLQVQIEGEAPSGSLILPLLLDNSRARKLFSDDYYATYKSSKDAVVLDNQEMKQVFLRQQLLAAEWAFIDQELACWQSDAGKGVNADFLQKLQLQPLFDSYVEFLRYFKRGKVRSTPSLEGWGPTLVGLAKQYVSAYLDYLQSLPVGKTLDSTTKFVMKLGLATLKDSESGRLRQYFTPFHPLVLSYYLHLVDEIVADGDERSFEKLAPVTLKRLNARGLIPHLYDDQQGYSYTQAVDTNPFWLEIVPREESSFEYITKLVKHKIEEFTETFSQLFKTVSKAPVLINSINNGDNSELFRGILAYYMDYLEDGQHIHVNLYDDDEIETEFDAFAEMATYDEIKDQYHLDKGAAKRNTDTIVDLLRTRLTFSKFRSDKVEQQAYAHLSFFRNNQVVDARDNNIDEHLSGIACGGLLNGESSRSENRSYFTAFGLKGVDCSDKPHLQIARLVGALWRPSKLSNDSYHEHSAICLAVSDDVKNQLQRSYDSSVWVTVIDPKVTLDFFQSTQKDMILIHYSDQYTSSAGYDAITVTKQAQLYRSVLGTHGESLIREFNAFNGEWLLQMVNDRETEKLGKEGVIGAYKLVAAMLSQSDICWVPLSVAEMIRVSGNIGLAMSDSDFARHNLGIKKGAISDDILFAGFKDGKLYLLPVEAKAGSRPDFKKARKQATELKTYMTEMLDQQNLAGRLYRGLFVRQVLLQIEKYQLYKVFDVNHFDAVLNQRETWLEGDYEIASLNDYPDGFVVAHINMDSCVSEQFEETNGILSIEVPLGKLDQLIHQPYQQLKEELVNGELLSTFPRHYLLGLEHPATFEESPQVEATNSSVDSPSAAGVAPLIPENAPSTELAHLGSEDEVNNASQSFVTEPLTIQFGTDVSTNQPVHWEPTNTEKLFNTNTGIIGTMGTGKTQFTKSVITQLVRNQHNNVGGTPIGILIFDYKADYIKDDFVEATGAKVFEPDCLPFNPFALYGDKKKLPVHAAGQFVASTAKAFGLGVKQQSRLRTVVRDAYEAAGIYANDASTWSRSAPTLEDVWSEFQAQDKVEHDSLFAALELLSSYEVFEPDSSKTQSLYDLVNGVVVINLSGYDVRIQNLVVALTLDLFYTQMHQQGSSKLDGNFRQISKMILVDEADNFMSQDFESLKKILKEGREFGVGTILSTQELTHFKTGDNDYSTLILSWVIHQVANIKSQEIKAIFNTQTKSDEEYFMGQIRKLEKHHSLCVDGKKKVSKIKDLAFWELIF